MRTSRPFMLISGALLSGASLLIVTAVLEQRSSHELHRLSDPVGTRRCEAAEPSVAAYRPGPAAGTPRPPGLASLKDPARPCPPATLAAVLAASTDHAKPATPSQRDGAHSLALILGLAGVGLGTLIVCHDSRNRRKGPNVVAASRQNGKTSFL